MDKKVCFTIGLMVGAFVTIIVWALAADITEHVKVEDGYLTYKTKTYTVTLYDELSIPEKELSNESNLGKTNQD